MTPETVLTIGRQGLETLLATAMPILLVILVVGLVISILQALTQINEQTLSFVPKLVLSGVALTIAGPWMLSTLTDFLQRMLLSIPAVINGQAGF
ncbi:MAG: flagellar biosynthesis protein FliQ [Lautropia sp.]|nr:flagellar biosynthesis protein FliQ [Lautropia sp.]